MTETERARDREVRKAMSVYLQELGPWDVYATLTFAPVQRWWLETSPGNEPAIRRGSVRSATGHPCPQTSVRRTVQAVDRFWRSLNDSYLGPRWHRWKDKSGRVKLFVPWERHKSGQYHCHPLVGNLPRGWRFTEVHDAWQAAQRAVGLTPGKAWLKPYVGKKELRDYVAKYVTKDLDGDAWSLYLDR